MNRDNVLRELIQANKDQIRQKMDYVVIYFHRYLLSTNFIPINQNELFTIIQPNGYFAYPMSRHYIKDDVTVTFTFEEGEDKTKLLVYAENSESLHKPKMGIVVDSFVIEMGNQYDFRYQELPTLREEIRKRFYDTTRAMKNKPKNLRSLNAGDTNQGLAQSILQSSPDHDDEYKQLNTPIFINEEDMKKLQ